MKYCTECAAPLELKVPADDDRERYVCSECGIIQYQNPRGIVGCLPCFGEQVLLCKRAIQPRYGLWTLPAGFMENGETTRQGAARETWEEARARVSSLELYRVFDVPYINQVYVFYRCRLDDGAYGVGPESLESNLFFESEIPWDEIAFPVVRKTLESYFRDRQSASYPIEVNDVIRKQRPPGFAPSASG